MSPEVKKAFELAIKARDKAYAPYSNYKVGAAIKACGAEAIYCSGNVENSCFPAGICAECNAVGQMVSQLGGQPSIEFVVVVSANSPAVAPCGICRQVLSEFANEKTRIYLANLQGIQKQLSIEDLLPLAYNKAQLKEGAGH